jgi:hypothetical protein
MPETVVPYERFVEIRQRRQRLVAELTKPPDQTPADQVLEAHPPEAFAALAVDEAHGLK